MKSILQRPLILLLFSLSLGLALITALIIILPAFANPTPDAAEPPNHPFNREFIQQLAEQSGLD